MTTLRTLILVVCAVVTAPAVTLYSDSFTADVSNPIPAGTTFAAGPAGGGGIGGAIGLIAPSAGTLTITVEDCCIVGDVYEVLLNGASLGLTSLVPMDGPVNSSGVFVAPIAAGAFSVDVWDITLSYIGSPSPFGGGDVPQDFSPAGGSIQVDFEAVPEPSAYVLMTSGLAGLLFMARRRR